jgi:hypothetical protein
MIDQQIEHWAKEVQNLHEQELLLEMARVGFFSDFEVWIRTDDPGNIPHFHVWDRNSKGGLFHTCVKIESPEYFHHTGKEDVFNSKQKKELIEFLNAKPLKAKWHPTNWDFIITLWNANNSNTEVDEKQPISDYTTLP